MKQTHDLSFRVPDEDKESGTEINPDSGLDQTAAHPAQSAADDGHDPDETRRRISIPVAIPVHDNQGSGLVKGVLKVKHRNLPRPVLKPKIQADPGSSSAAAADRPAGSETESAMASGKEIVPAPAPAPGSTLKPTPEPNPALNQNPPNPEPNPNPESAGRKLKLSVTPRKPPAEPVAAAMGVPEPHQGDTVTSGRTEEKPLPSKAVKPASSQEEVEPDRGKPLIKHRKTSMPPSAQKFMEEQAQHNQPGRKKAKDRQPTEPKSTGASDYLSGLAAWLLVTVGLGLAIMPLWPETMVWSEFSPALPLALGGVIVIMATLLLPRLLVTRALAGFVLLMLMAFLALLIFSDQLPGKAQHLLLATDIFTYVSTSKVLATVFLLTTAAFILNFNFSIMQLILALISLTAAGVVPFAPPPFLPEHPPLVLPAGFIDSIPQDQWNLSSRGWDYIQWTARDSERNRLTLVYFPASAENTGKTGQAGPQEPEPPQDPLRAYIQTAATDQGLGPISTLPFANRSEHQRYLSFGPDSRAIDGLGMKCETQGGRYLILFEVGDYFANQSFINEFYQAVKF